MQTFTLETYAQQFRKLRRDYRNGGAPHKPVLLLSVAQLVLSGTISDNRVRISPELVLAFKSNWSKLVVTPHHPNFSLPFFHLRTAAFWQLVPYPGMQIGVTSSASVKSFRNLQHTIAYAQIDEELLELLQHPVANAFLQNTLLDQYFPDTKSRLYAYSIEELTGDLEQQMMHETGLEYRERITELEHSLPKEELEEELFVRSAVFKREIPKLYGYRCAISGLRVDALMNVQLVDACHIVPFSQSKDDTISNGICLTPTLHRAFDRGLIGIDPEYRVRVLAPFTESDSPYALKQFEGKSILLPELKEHWPGIDNLKWHWGNRSH